MLPLIIIAHVGMFVFLTDRFAHSVKSVIYFRNKYYADKDFKDAVLSAVKSGRMHFLVQLLWRSLTYGACLFVLAIVISTQFEIGIRSNAS